MFIEISFYTAGKSLPALPTFRQRSVGSCLFYLSFVLVIHSVVRKREKRSKLQANVPLDRVFSIFRLCSLSTPSFASEKSGASYKPTFRWIVSFLSFVCARYPLRRSQARKAERNVEMRSRFFVFQLNRDITLSIPTPLTNSAAASPAL